MKNLLVGAALAASLAAPAFAQQADVSADPFLSTQGTTELAIVGGMTALVVIAAATSGDNDSSSGTPK
ncbi:MAG: hypothetical protein EP318_03805 [Rhodobacteraceae bacterium]|nr:MAG: hypothetical protein EP318_03805 [Paracoccaceae bacterium]